MEIYDYKDAVINDIKNYIKNHYTIEELKERLKPENEDKLYQELYDDMFISDEVTGNGSGSYTFSRQKAIEYITSDFENNMELIADAFEEFGCEASQLKKGAEALDVSIRCWLLGDWLGNVMEDIRETLLEDE